MKNQIRLRIKWLASFGLALIATSALAGVGIVRDPHRTDRPGGDIQRSLLPRADPELCVRQCVSDQRCASYTYVRPGLQDKQAVCYLKSSRRRTVKNDCCESGIKIAVQDRRPPGPPPRIQPPESPNKPFCSTTLVCGGGKRGRWNDDTQSCDCPLGGVGGEDR